MDFWTAVGVGFVIGLFVGVLITGLCAVSGRSGLESEIMMLKERLAPSGVRRKP